MTNKELERKVDNLTDRFEALISSLTYGGKSISKLLPHKENPIVEKEQPKEEFKVGVWYKNNCGVVVNYQGGNNGYGVNGDGVWEECNNWSFKAFPESWTKATSQEIETALIKEAKKRGFKEGVEMENTGINDRYSLLSRVIGKKGIWMIGDNVIECGNGHVFRDGKWATIIEDSFEIAGHQVEIITNHNTSLDGNATLETKIVKIGCQTFSKEALIDLYDSCKDCGIDRVEHQEYDYLIEVKDLKELIDYINK